MNCECISLARESQHPHEKHNRTCPKYRPLKCWYEGECDYIVAETAEEARAVQVKNMGSEDAAPVDAWYEVPMDKVLSINIDGDWQATPVKKTVGEWIAIEGPGLLCSSEW
jgi:hypothetical protein